MEPELPYFCEHPDKDDYHLTLFNTKQDVHTFRNKSSFCNGCGSETFVKIDGIWCHVNPESCMERVFKQEN